ncbi:hypothetical protein D5086_009025 [Populus alba]|uniref:Uncharacterized protein n=1 Tax=Populus alba TaxID=43335 RepID=A0ACC4CHL2_POPAL
MNQSAPVLHRHCPSVMEGISEACLTRPRSYNSANREASFGHAVFDTRNRTHAYYSWDCNEDVGNLF